MSSAPLGAAGRAAYSLRQRLLVLLIGVVAAGWMGTGIVAFGTAHQQADELFDAQLVQVAETLLAIVATGQSDDLAMELAEHQHENRLPVAFQVWRQEGGEWRLLIRSPEMPEAAVLERVGFDEHTLHGVLWRFYGLDHPGARYRVVVGQNHAARYHLALEVVWHLIWPMLLGLPLMALAIRVVVGRALGPMAAVADRVRGMDARHLQPLDLKTPLPGEVLPLVQALDALVLRLGDALVRERQFTADAAHELRTPLAALKVHLQVAQRARVDEDRTRALAQVEAGVLRMQHLVSQLLTLARLEPEAAHAHAAQEQVDLVQVAERVCGDMANRAVQRDQSLGLEYEGPCVITGNGGWVEILLRNLVDNALRYTPAGGQILIRLEGGRPLEARYVLRVLDDGPGIAAEDMDRVLTRFARGSSVEEEGCGLGLSIVARIVTMMDGRLSLEPGLPRPQGGHGLGVRVVLGSGSGEIAADIA